MNPSKSKKAKEFEKYMSLHNEVIKGVNILKS